MNNEPTISIGIMSEPQVDFNLAGAYSVSAEQADGKLIGLSPVEGKQTATAASDGLIAFGGGHYRTLEFTPIHPQTSTFALERVTIGIGFHWERRERQVFAGALRLMVNAGRVQVINRLPTEAYLVSVISSEMSAHASLELLKAHAVISRSWLLAQLNGASKADEQGTNDAADTVAEVGERIRWYDHSSHTLFDVCADDHCQRYQGLTRPITPAARQAVEQTRGEVLTCDGEIADTRFSKCCGGAFEEYATCWENEQRSYLSRGLDLGKPACQLSKPARRVRKLENQAPNNANQAIDATDQVPDLTREEEAERWIRSYPEAFCHTTDRRILRQVLNDYDLETHDFYRWTVRYTQDELSALIRRRSGIDFGGIVGLIPLSRGTSGRIYRLKIVGTRRTMVIGKELEIRRTLSASHLYSSAFVVDTEYEAGRELPSAFKLTGAGWGHGVGLCQIGAAVMGERGYGYRDILAHYYKGATVEKAYL